MKISERLAYLLVILTLMLFDVSRLSWFSDHYDYLNEKLGLIEKICTARGLK
jgi:hypothetical protein